MRDLDTYPGQEVDRPMLDFLFNPHYGIGRLHGHNPFQPNECALS